MKKRRAMILSVLTAGVLALTGCGSTQSAETDPEADYVMVEDDVELEAMSKVFSQMMDDVDIEM